MKLKNNDLEIAVCDLCTVPAKNRVAIGECLVCKQDYCENCQGSRYYSEKWLTYELRNGYAFCKNCWDKMNKLTSADYSEIIGEKITSYNPADEFSKWSNLLFNNAKQNARDIISQRMLVAIKKSDELYKDKIADDLRKAQIQKEIDMLEKQKENLKKSIQ